MLPAMPQSAQPAPIGRLAPSPTGALHIGNIRTFLWAWLSVRSRGGRMILRVEDLERPALPGVTEAMLSDLEWLGFDWDEGPKIDASGTVTQIGDHAPYIQGERRDYYEALFKDLRARGLIYPCVCTRADFAASAPHQSDGELRYPGTCRGRFANEAEAREQSGREPVWRFRTSEGPVSFDDLFRGPHSFEPQAEVGDFVVFKNPRQPAYQLAVVADDIAMGVTEVVRGDDLLSSAARQTLLYRAFDAEPPRYGHVPLILGPDGKRIAKRHGDSRIRFYREQGLSPAHIVGTLARWSGFEVGPCTPAELIGLWGSVALNKDTVVLDGVRHRELLPEQ